MTGASSSVLRTLTHSCALLGSVALLVAGCSHTPPASGASKEGSPHPSANEAPLPAVSELIRYTSDDIGVSISLPAALQFRMGDSLGTLARAADSTEFRVFIEHLPNNVDERACWERLYKRIPPALLDSPRDVDELIALAAAGIRRGERFIYLSVHPQGTRCYVLVGEGPRDSRTLVESVPVARKTFEVRAPSDEMSAEFDVDGGLQLLEAKEYVAALERFERALSVNPQNPRARFGAGLAAYFAGPEYAGKAVEHLSIVTSQGIGDEVAPQLRPEQFRDALMYLGLAYAAQKNFPRATATLAELVTREPGDATGRYNLACVLALAGDRESAFNELRIALQKEPSLIAHAKQDEDLKSLRDSPEWTELFQSLESSVPQRSAR